jgi:hypothetical protein
MLQRRLVNDYPVHGAIAAASVPEREERTFGWLFA